MLLHESRRAARVDAQGDVVLLEDQDRALWNNDLLQEGTTLVEKALASQKFGPYTVQAAISAVHAAYEKALSLSEQEPEKRFLEKRLREL